MIHPRGPNRRQPGTWCRRLLAALVLLVVLAGGRVATVTAQRNVNLSPSAAVRSSNGKLDGNLQAMLASATTLGADDLVEPILVSVHLRPEAAQATPQGLNIDLRHGTQVWGWTTRRQLADLASDPSVLLVTLPVEPVAAALSEGVALSGATTWQLAGYDGAGYTIAVLDKGFMGYAALLGSELPLAPTTRSFRSDGDLEAGSAHGTACAEVAMDMAPQAEYYLVNVSTDGEYQDAAQWLIDEGVDIVLCGLGWPISGPGNGTGPIAQVAQNALDAGIVWVNASGNLGTRHWMGSWVDDGDGYLNFTAIDETNELQVRAGEVCRIGMRWDDSWDTAVESFSLELYDDSLTKVAETQVAATGPGDPTRYLRLTGLAAGRYHIAVRRLEGSGAPTIELFTFDQDLLEHITPASSLAVPADVPGVVAVGAVAWDAPTLLETFSSRGPSRGGVLKPDLVAPDRVSSVSYGAYVPGSSVGFQGTSASAAHVAGAAALVWQMYPLESAAGITDLLRRYGRDLGVVGPDDATGYGRLDLGPAVTLTPGVEPTLPVAPTATLVPTLPAGVTPSATPTVTSTSTRTATPSATTTSGATATVTQTPAETATVTQTPAGTATVTQTPAGTATATGTSTPSLTPSLTRTSGPTSTPVFAHLPMIYKNANDWTTPSPTPSVTPTFTATVTPTATATTGPTPLPSNCRELVRDGGFESGTYWQFGVTPSSAARVPTPVHSGLRAVRMGILPGATNVQSHSSAYQYFTIPWNAQTVTLTFAWQRGTEEPSGFESSNLLMPPSSEPQSVHTLVYDQDMQEVILIDTIGNNILTIAKRGRATDAAWETVTCDLSAYAGYTVMLYFNVYNDGLGGRSWAYLDDVSFVACTP